MSSFDEGMRAFNKKDYHTAITLFLQATEEDEQNHKAWNALGVTYVNIHQYNDADTCFKNAIALAPGNDIYLKNRLKNRGNVSVKRSLPHILRLEIDHLILSIKTRKTGPLIAALLAVCLICIILFFILPLVTTGSGPDTTQLFGFLGLVTGIAFILLLYGEHLRRSLSSKSGVALVIVVIGGAALITWLILHPSLLPIGNSNASYEHPVSLVNITSESPVQHQPEVTAGPTQTGESIPLPLSPGCTKPVPNLSYTITDYDPFNVSFQDDMFSPTPIVGRIWNFGDGTTSTEPAPVHVYSGSPGRYLINYTVQNSCGAGSATLTLDPGCHPLTPGLISSPVSAANGKTILFSDISAPLSDITSWRWIFGDGESYYTFNPALRNCSHQYPGEGTFYASLIVQNRCKQDFTISRPVTIGGTILVSGIVWEDENADGIWDPAEPGLANWEVNLDENIPEGWITRQTTRTSQSGAYLFTLSSPGGSYRVRESAPDLSWRITNPSNPYFLNASSLLTLSVSNITPPVNFGNRRQKSDKLHEISLYSSRNGLISGDGYQSWIVSGTTGTMTIGKNQSGLGDGDRCMITIPSNASEGLIRINGSTHRYSRFHPLVKIRDSDVSSDGNISVFLPAYANYLSNLHLKLNPGKSTYVNLVVDGTVIPVNWRQQVDLYDLMPAAGPHMVLHMSGNETIFVGQASDYSVT